MKICPAPRRRFHAFPRGAAPARSEAASAVLAGTNGRAGQFLLAAATAAPLARLPAWGGT